MSIIPFKDALERLIKDSFILPMALPAIWAAGTIPLDIVEKENKLVVKALLPLGIKPEDLDIEVDETVLTISGETKLEMVRKRDNYFFNERRYGQVRRSVTLPYDVNIDKVEAKLDGGILTVTLPKAEATKGMKISLKPEAKAVQQEVKAEVPEAKVEKPVEVAEKPVVKAKKPEANAEEPKMKAEAPVAKAEKPVANAEKPKAKTEKPEAKAEKPAANAEAPEVKAEAPEVKAELPVAKVEKPKTKAEKPKTKTEKPKAKASKPVEKTEKPEAKAEKQGAIAG